MKNILITGASGFVGTHLISRLKREGFIVLALGDSDGSITDEKTLSLYENKTISHVFHLAAKTYVPESWEKPKLFYDVNVGGTLNVLEFCRKKQCRLTYVSSYLYGVPEKLPINENSPLLPGSPYAHSKYLAEKLCEFYADAYGVGITILRPFNIFGEGQSERFLIPSLIKQALSKGDVIKAQDLAPKRDYLYISDFVEALLSTIGRHKKNCSIYNIGAGYSLSVNEIISVIQRMTGSRKKVVSKNIRRKNEILDVVADIRKVKKELSWRPKTSFCDGIVNILAKPIVFKCK